MLLANEAKRLTHSENICLAGGVALNGVANGKLHESGLFRHIFIQPAAGDAGGALGAAYAAHHLFFGKERILNEQKPDALLGAYLGPEFAETDILRMARKFGASYRFVNDFGILAGETAKLLDAGNVIGWFQGRMEFGPRALGSRSILADARNPEMQKKLNLSIKFREGFRPFAPAVLAEEVQDYFEFEEPSPYMLMVKGVRKSRRVNLPEHFADRSLTEKLYFQRSDLPAVTHIDYSARIQTVHRETNPKFWQLLYSFRELTGCAELVNTSFNVRDEPIVNTPEEAYRCFMRTEMDFLVMGAFIFEKKLQPPLRDK
jgi:carbamoyltransferase